MGPKKWAMVKTVFAKAFYPSHSRKKVYEIQAICSSAHSFSHTDHLFACSALLASLTRSFLCSLRSSWEKDLCPWIECIGFMQFQPIVPRSDVYQQEPILATRCSKARGNRRKWEGVTDLPTDGRTDGRTDGTPKNIFIDSPNCWECLKCSKLYGCGEAPNLLETLQSGNLYIDAHSLV